MFIDADDFIKIPLDKMPTGHRYFQLTINDVVGTFLLDTGASKSCIGFEESARFDVAIKKDSLEAAGAGAEKLVVHRSKKSHIRHDNYALGRLNFLIMDLAAINASLKKEKASPVDGIIGADFLHKNKAVIRYRPDFLYLKK